MDTNLTAIFILGIAASIMIIVVIWFIISLTVLSKLNNKYLKDAEDLKELKEANGERIIDYSKQMLEFIKMMVGQVSVIKFRTYIDNNKLDKTAKPNIEKIVEDVANTVNDAINVNNISLKDTIYTKEFFEQYIVETSILMIKQMLEKTIDEENYDGE